MMMRGCFWGFLVGATIALLVTIASVVADPSPFEEGKWGATWIMLTLVFGLPGALVGTAIGFLISLFHR
jgi:hypothetical protein